MTETGNVKGMGKEGKGVRTVGHCRKITPRNTKLRVRMARTRLSTAGSERVCLASRIASRLPRRLGSAHLQGTRALGAPHSSHTTGGGREEMLP